jgi:outer membrane protein
MKKYLTLFVISTLAFAGLSAYLIFGKENDSGSNQQKVVFMDSYLVFEEFTMKKDYDGKLEKELKTDQASLDSLGRMLNGTKDALKLAALKKDFTVRKLAFDEKFKELSQQYTNEVYVRLNEYIKTFGKKHGYSMILGSNGDGNVMYVDKSQDITKDLITFINESYSN